MKLDAAIRKRINEFIKDKKSLTAICLNSNITPSTIFDFMNGKSKYPNILTIKRLCVGLGITLQEFFNTPYFNEDDAIY